MIIGIVVAGNYIEYMKWIRKKKLNPKEYKFVWNPIDLAGIRNVFCYYIGTYERNPLYLTRDLINTIKPI